MQATQPIDNDKTSKSKDLSFALVPFPYYLANLKKTKDLNSQMLIKFNSQESSDLKKPSGSKKRTSGGLPSGDLTFKKKTKTSGASTKESSTSDDLLSKLDGSLEETVWCYPPSAILCSKELSKGLTLGKPNVIQSLYYFFLKSADPKCVKGEKDIRIWDSTFLSKITEQNFKSIPKEFIEKENAKNSRDSLRAISQKRQSKTLNIEELSKDQLLKRFTVQEGLNQSLVDLVLIERIEFLYLENEQYNNFDLRGVFKSILEMFPYNRKTASSEDIFTWLDCIEEEMQANLENASGPKKRRARKSKIIPSLRKDADWADLLLIRKKSPEINQDIIDKVMPSGTYALFNDPYAIVYLMIGYGHYGEEILKNGNTDGKGSQIKAKTALELLEISPPRDKTKSDRLKEEDEDDWENLSFETADNLENDEEDETSEEELAQNQKIEEWFKKDTESLRNDVFQIDKQAFRQGSKIAKALLEILTKEVKEYL